jgi:hypothetical protein
VSIADWVAVCDGPGKGAGRRRIEQEELRKRRRDFEQKEAKGAKGSGRLNHEDTKGRKEEQKEAKGTKESGRGLNSKKRMGGAKL